MDHYYTKYTLVHNAETEAIAKAIDKVLDEDYGLVNQEEDSFFEDLSWSMKEDFIYAWTYKPQQKVKWYGHENVMKYLAKRFPDVCFTLSGIGELSGDYWQKHFKGDKMQFCKGTINVSYPPCELI